MTTTKKPGISPTLMAAQELHVALRQFGKSVLLQPGFEEHDARRVQRAISKLAAMSESDSDSESPEGVWVVYYKDNGWHINSIHQTEIEALRSVADLGYGKAAFVPFGADWTSAIA